MKKTLQLTEQQLNIILFALQKQPFEMVNELMHDIVGQIRTQQIKTEELKTE